MKYVFYLYVFSVFVSASELTSMKNACENGMSEACYELGSIFTGEDGLQKDYTKALFYLRKSCELDNDKACNAIEILEANNTQS